jgi:hypothetical protein
MKMNKIKMKRIKTYENLEEALKNIQKKDKEYISVWHKFSAGESVGLHYHHKANEWVIALGPGSFKVIYDYEIKTVNIKGKKAYCITFPREVPHNIECLTDMLYFVVRDKKDSSIELKQ